MIDFNKITSIIEENNWEADVDKLFIAMLGYLNNNKKKLTKEYSVNELCDLCKEINEKKGIFKKSALNYPKNVLFSNLSGRDYIIFSEDFDIDVNELITSAIKGNVDNQTIGKKILAQLFSGAREAISTIRKHYGNYNSI